MDGFSSSQKLRWSSFKGQSTSELRTKYFCYEGRSRLSSLVMRKQKASDKRTRRLQREGRNPDNDNLGISSFTNPHGPSYPKRIRSPMADSSWSQRSMISSETRITKGRGRSRKRTNKYESLSTYHAEFLNLLTAEYFAEEKEVIGRIEASINDPLSLEAAGHALFDLYPERRGNIFSDEVYRLVKAHDATTVFYTGDHENDEKVSRSDLPSNHKFSTNDVIMLTLQTRGSGDFFGISSLPTHKDSISLEARVLNTGPYYIDIAISGGSFEGTFGPAPNNTGPSGKGDPGMRIRADRFLSNVPYTRMVAALNQMTSVTPKKASQSSSSSANKNINTEKKERKINMDPLLKEIITSTHAFENPSCAVYQDTSWCDINDLARRIAKPPLPTSSKLANEALSFIQSDPHKIFRSFNGPQLAAIGAALTRRLTLIQGPPGTGKTTVGTAIGFGFAYQCKSISPHAKVLACAFSNVGADNLAEGFLKLGLKVVRVGKASGISESLWDYTLDAAIAKDPIAQKALAHASLTTSNIKNNKRGSSKKSKIDVVAERAKREAATIAVKASIQACRIAATKALREADIIVSTSIGAADSRLLAACGIYPDEEENDEDEQRLKSFKTNSKSNTIHQMRTRNEKVADSKSHEILRRNAPDQGPPLSLPFVILDEACQSVEPGDLIPITSTDSCRSLVLLGDPCQLPPTVKCNTSALGNSNSLSTSLMSRLASILPHPAVFSPPLDKTERDESFLNFKPTHQAVSLIKYRSEKNKQHFSYRKKYAGSLLLSVQYRMHPSISAFSSAVFYDGLLTTPDFLSQHREFPVSFGDILPAQEKALGVRFIDVGGQKNESKGWKMILNSSTSSVFEDGNKSYSNEAEATIIVQLLKDIFKKEISLESFTPTIGVVTPYSAQVALLKSKMAKDQEFRMLAQNHPAVIEVKSVDAYQGRERDVIVFSAVRSNHNGKIGFLKDWRRMNVALTRAKSGLIVVGDMETLMAGDKHWEAFGKWCQSVSCAATISSHTVH